MQGNALIPLMGEPMNLARNVAGGAVAGNQLMSLIEDRKMAPMRQQAAQMEMEAGKVNLESGKLKLSRDKALEQLRRAAFDVAGVRMALASGDPKRAAAQLRQRRADIIARDGAEANTIHTDGWIAAIESGDPAQIDAFAQEAAEIESAYQTYDPDARQPSAPAGWTNKKTDAQGNVWGDNPQTGAFERIPSAQGVSFTKPDAGAQPSYSRPVEGIDPVTGERVFMRFDNRSQQGIPVTGFQPAPDAAPTVGFADESKLRKEYMATVKPYVDQNASFGRLQVSANNPTPAGDMALIFNYMKILDPASAVREAEYATAANAGAVPDKVYNLYNKVLSGEQLSPRQRADFYQRGKLLFSEATRQHETIKNEYRRIATDNGFKPENVLINVQTADPGMAVDTTSQNETKVLNGVTYILIDGKWYEQ